MTIRNIYELAQTWDNGAEEFTAFGLNVTDTASASGSLLMDLQVDGTSVFRFGKTSVYGLVIGSGTYMSLLQNSVTSEIDFNGGIMRFWGGSGDSIELRVGELRLPGCSLGFSTGFSSSPDVRLYRDSANTLAQRNGANAQAFNIYNKRIDASNYERVTFGWSGNVFSISPNAAGTGSTRVIHISGLPTSNPGPGILWNNAGTPAIGT